MARPQTLILAALLAVVAALPRAARADDGPSVVELTPATEDAIERGLKRLAELQVPQTGNFGKQFKVASTSLAGLALLASGDTWGRGQYSPNIESAVRYLLSDSVKVQIPRKPGFYWFRDNESQGKMHAHGFATLFLAEVYGQTPLHPPRDKEIHDALRGAVAATLDAQTDLGGWGYYFRHEAEWGDDEASVTITQIQALRAARNAGIYVPAEAIARAVGYVKKSMAPDGQCRYSLTMGGAERDRKSFELTAAAVATLNASGVYIGGGEGSLELERGLGFMRKAFTQPGLKNPADAATDFYFYGNFYAAQAMYQSTNEDWEFWFPRARQALLAKQDPRGQWESPRNFGQAYATASALLILQIPRRYLSILQK